MNIQKFECGISVSLPSEEAVKVALRTQQILAEETGIIDTIDPLGGSYYIEYLTSKMEEEAYRYFEKIESLGGILEAVKKGYIQREIAATSYRRQKRLEDEKEIMVGVNKYVDPDEKPINILRIGKDAEEMQLKRIKEVKAGRDQDKVNDALAKLDEAFRNPDENVMPYIIEAVKTYATIEEISDVGRKIYGGIHNILRCGQKANIQYLHSCIPECLGQNEDTPVMPINSGFCKQYLYWFLPKQ